MRPHDVHDLLLAHLLAVLDNHILLLCLLGGGGGEGEHAKQSEHKNALLRWTRRQA